MGKLRELDNYVTNLSIGAGETLAGGVDALAEALRNPRAAARGAVEGARAFAASPRGALSNTASDYRTRLASGPIGVGSVLAEFIPSPGKAANVALRQTWAPPPGSVFPPPGVRNNRYWGAMNARMTRARKQQEAQAEALRKAENQRRGHERAQRWAKEMADEDAYQQAMKPR